MSKIKIKIKAKYKSLAVFALAAVMLASLAGVALTTLPVKTRPAEAAVLDDLVHLYPPFSTSDEFYEAYLNWYYFNNLTEGLNFNYQLREVSNAVQASTYAGAQWFATVAENYFWNYYYLYLQDEDKLRTIRRRTLGGQTNQVPMVTSADLTNDFGSVFVRETQPYQKWLETFPLIFDSETSPYWQGYDDYMDPIESICVVVPNGSGKIVVYFGNHYARHNPWWYGWDNTQVNPEMITISGDVPALDPDTNLPVLGPDGEPVFVSGDISVDAIPHDVYEHVTLNMAKKDDEDESSYNINATPYFARKIQPGEYLPVTISFNITDPEDYGSKVAYMGFGQNAKFDSTSYGWSESSLIPVVIANVYDGLAADPGHELYFDVLIFERGRWVDEDNNDLGYIFGDIVNRVKFRWGANKDEGKFVGYFYPDIDYQDTPDLTEYELETRITNRTGTRYRVQRYDKLPLDLRNSKYSNILPDYWMYDVIPDRYDTLPQYFNLDPQSQIAPGLITVYRSNVSSGYNTLDVKSDTNPSFRLYTFASNSVPHDLTLKNTRVRGWDKITAGKPCWSPSYNPETGNYSYEWRLQPFTITFSDRDSEKKFEEYMALPPVIVKEGGAVSADALNIGNDQICGFELSSVIPEGTVTYTVISQDETSDETSQDEADVVSQEPNNIAMQPVRVRLRVPRSYSQISDHWNKLVEAEEQSQEALLTEFHKHATIWVYSENAVEKVADLIDARSEVKDCIRAFTYKDDYNNESLYLDFIAFLADAESLKPNKKPFCEVFTDNDVPYILLGDGKVDGTVKFTFYVGKLEEIDREPEKDETPDLTDNSNSNGSGGGCMLGLGGLAGLALLGILKHRKTTA